MKFVRFIVFAIEPVGLYMSLEELSRGLREVVNAYFVPSVVFALSVRVSEREDSDIRLYC